MYSRFTKRPRNTYFVSSFVVEIGRSHGQGGRASPDPPTPTPSGRHDRRLPKRQRGVSSSSGEGKREGGGVEVPEVTYPWYTNKRGGDLTLEDPVFSEGFTVSVSVRLTYTLSTYLSLWSVSGREIVGLPVHLKRRCDGRHKVVDGR